MINSALDYMGMAVTIIVTDGILLYYNREATRILDRNPKYIGSSVYSHHLKKASSDKLEKMIQDFKNGRTEPFHHEATPYEKTILVTLAPILDGGKFISCSQTAL